MQVPIIKLFTSSVSAELRFVNNPKKVSISDEIPALAIHLLDRFGNSTEITELEDVTVLFTNSKRDVVVIEKQPTVKLEDGSVILQGFLT